MTLTAFSLLAATGFAPAFSGIFLLFILLVVVASIFWIWMLVDALVNEPSGADKIFWVLIILFLHLLGALFYFFLRRGHGAKPMA